MDVELRTPEALFKDPIRYVVPEYQRRYVWTHEAQWEPLWTDIQDLAEQRLEQLGRATEEIVPIRPHFLGSIVLARQPDPSNQLPTLAIVDGQQRLLTLQLMLDAAQQECVGRHAETARTLSELVLNPAGDQHVERDHEFKMWPADDDDRAAFRSAMRNDLPTDAHEKERIVEAHSWFAERVRTWLSARPKTTGERALALKSALTEHLQIATIELGENDDEQVVFETLNSRGTPLGTFELVKNFLMREARDQKIDPQRLRRQHLSKLEQKWWGRMVGSGRSRRPHIEAFLHHWLTMETGQEVRLEKTFSRFRQHISDDRQGQVESVADEIADFAMRYKAIQEADKEYDEFGFGDFISRLKVLGTDAFMPLILWLWKHIESDAQVGRAYDALESYMVRRLICDLDTRVYSALALDLLDRVKRSRRKGPDTIIVEHLAGLPSEREQWPTDSEVTRSLVNNKLLGPVSSARTRMILEAVELSFRGSPYRALGLAELTARQLSVEHVMPRHWRTADWARPKPLPARSEETAEEIRDRLVHSIGNLTLVSRRRNSQLSDSNWTRKRSVYREDRPSLALTADLVSPGGKAPARVWDEEQIRKRSERLAKRVIRVWPRPS